MAEEKSGDGLRGERQHISLLVTRLELVRVALLLILVFSFTRAFERIDGVEVTAKRREQEALSQQAQTPSEVNPYKDPFGFTREYYGGDDDGPLQARSDSEVPPEVKAAREKLRGVEKELDNLYRQAFVVNPSLIGSSVEIDLRYWVFILPFILLLSQIYLHVLRCKLRAVNAVGANLVGKDDQQVTPLDRLFFHHTPRVKTAYASHPFKLEKWLFGSVALLLTLYLAAVGRPLWGNWTFRAKVLSWQVLWLSLFYSLAYAASVTNAVNEQLRGLDIDPGEDDRLRRLYAWARARFERAVSRSRVLLWAGTSFVLSSLILPSIFAQPGYRIVYSLREAVGAVTSGESDEVWAGLAALIDLTFYVSGVLLGFFTLILLLAYFWRPGTLRANSRGVVILYRGAGALIIYEVTTFSLDFLWSFIHPALVFIINLVWLVPFFLWYFYSFAGDERRLARWPAVRTRLLVIYIPLGVNALVAALYAAFSGGYGYLLFFVGLCLMFLGYMRFGEVSAPSRGPAEERDSAIRTGAVSEPDVLTPPAAL